MNRVNRIHAPTILLLALLCGCGEDRSSSTTSETENVVTAREFIVDSILPAWLPLDSRPVVATLRLNASHLPFDSIDSAARSLDFVDMDGEMLPFEISYWDKASKSGRIHVRIEDPRASLSSRIRMRWNRPAVDRSNADSTWKGITPDRRLILNSLLLDDFEDGDVVSRVPSGASWFTSAPQESTSVEPPGIVRDSLRRSGNVLSAAFVADRSKFRYVVLGLGFGTLPLAFRGMDSLTLAVRGPTRLSVQCEHVGAGVTRKAWLHFDLDSTWKTLSIKPGDFLPADGTGSNVVGWDGVRDSINALTFLMSGGTRVWMDDIRIHGLNQDDFR